jgi:hypothetical protein
MIPKLENYQYIYISIPQAKLIDEDYIEISIKKVFPVWAIVLIVIGALVILAFIIILIKTKCCKESNFCVDCCLYSCCC